MLKRLMLALAVLLLVSPLRAQAVPRDSLLARMTGHWVLRGTIARQQVVHDVSFDWVLGDEYLEMHEVSRERTPEGAPSYEAIVYLGHDPHTNEYAVMWLDNTAYGAFGAGGMGRGKAVADSIPLLFTYTPTSRFHTTFVYDQSSDSWAWHMDNDDEKGRRPFARVTLTRK